jgi:outer membrane protein OmpA-like peptidoglycan-associated protein
VLVKTGPGYGAENTVHISLTPKACAQTIEGTVVSSDLNYQLNPVQVALYEGTNLLKTVTTNNQFTFQVNCNTTYTLVASSEHFESNQVTFSTTAEHAVELPKNMVLNPKICTQKIEVIAFNSSNNVQLNTAKIALYHQQKLVEEAVIVNTNSLFFNVQCNANYTLVCEAPTFETTEITFQTDASFDTVSLQKLYVKPQPCLQNITFNIFNKETKEPLQGATLTLFNNNEQISLQQLTTNEHTFEVACNNNYTLKVALEKFNTQQVDFITTNTYNETLTRAIYLTPATDYITLGGQKLINTNTIYFDLDKADIRYDAAIELNKVVSYLTNNPHVKIEVKSHTDSRAPDSYNLKLSNNRAQSVINYIISKGIDASRVDGKGYGETQLLNHCANGVKCSEAEHQLNRRTEFVIIE